MWHVERLLEEAAGRGEFDGVKGRAVRIDDDGPGWWVRRRLEAERDAETGDAVVTAVEAALGSVWLLPSERDVRHRVEQLNDVLIAAGRDDSRLDPDETVVTWRRMARLRLNRS